MCLIGKNTSAYLYVTIAKAVKSQGDLHQDFKTKSKSTTQASFAYLRIKVVEPLKKTPPRFSASGCAALPPRSHANSEL